MTIEKVLKRHELIKIVTRRRKLFLDLMLVPPAWWIDVLRVPSRKNNSEKLARFRDGFKSENLKKNKKNEGFFFRFYLKNTPNQHKINNKKEVFDAL